VAVKKNESDIEATQKQTRYQWWTIVSSIVLYVVREVVKHVYHV